MKNKPRLSGKSQNQTNKQGIYYQGILRGLLVGWVWSAVLLLMLAMVIHLTSLSDKILPLSTIGIGLVGSLLAGYQAAVRTRHQGLLHGALAGALYGLVIIVASVFFLPTSVGALAMAWKLATLTAAGGIGGIIGV